MRNLLALRDLLTLRDLPTRLLWYLLAERLWELLWLLAHPLLGTLGELASLRLLNSLPRDRLLLSLVPLVGLGLERLL